MKCSWTLKLENWEFIDNQVFALKRILLFHFNSRNYYNQKSDLLKIVPKLFHLSVKKNLRYSLWRKPSLYKNYMYQHSIVIFCSLVKHSNVWLFHIFNIMSFISINEISIACPYINKKPDLHCSNTCTIIQFFMHQHAVH